MATGVVRRFSAASDNIHSMPLGQWYISARDARRFERGTPDAKPRPDRPHPRAWRPALPE